MNLSRDLTTQFYVEPPRAPAFDPKSLATCLHHFDASTQVYLDDAATTVSEDNGDVAYWMDQEAGPTGMIQTSAAARPHQLYTSLNGYPAILFNGTTHYLTLDPVAQSITGNDISYAIAMVGAFKALTEQIFFSTADSLGSGTYANHGITSEGKFYSERSDGSSPVTVSSTASLDTNFHVYMVHMSGITLTVYVDGVQIVNSTHNTGGIVVAKGAFGAKLAGNDAVSLYTNMVVSEVAVFRGLTFSSDFNLVGQGLARKYGLSWTTIS